MQKYFQKIVFSLSFLTLVFTSCVSTKSQGQLDTTKIEKFFIEDFSTTEIDGDPDKNQAVYENVIDGDDDEGSGIYEGDGKYCARIKQFNNDMSLLNVNVLTVYIEQKKLKTIYWRENAWSSPINFPEAPIVKSETYFKKEEGTSYEVILVVDGLCKSM
jgi:hypothetical protein